MIQIRNGCLLLDSEVCVDSVLSATESVTSGGSGKNHDDPWSGCQFAYPLLRFFLLNFVFQPLQPLQALLCWYRLLC